MDYTISIADGPRAAALTRARAAYAASNPALSEQEFIQKVVDGQLDALVTAYVVTTLSRLAFLNRFTAEERVAVRAAATQSPQVDDYLQMLAMADNVDITHATTIMGVQALEAAGLIAQGRAAEILAL